MLIGGAAYAAINLTAQKPAQHSSLKPGINIDQGEKGLVGWWKLNGNTKDSTPYQDNGILVNNPTPTTDRKGTANGAYSFDGTSNQYVRIPDSTALDSTPTNQWTMAAWIDPTSNASGSPTILRKDVAGDGYFLRISGGQLQSLFRWSDGSFSQSNCANVTFNQWQLVVVTYDGSTIRHYINGNLVCSWTYNKMLDFVTTSSLCIGAYHCDVPNPTSYFQGSIADVRLYNRALSQQDITNLYNSYNSQINLYSPPGSGNGVNLTAGLIGYWPFNGNANDATPYQNNGTVYGATLTAGHTGQANSAYQTGDTQFIQIGSPAAYANLPRAFTYSLWVKDTGTPSNPNPQIMGPNITHTYFGIRAANSGANVTYEYGTPPYDGTSFSTINFGSLPLNTWVMCTVTYDGSTIRSYVNGVLSTTSSSVTINPVFGGLNFSDDNSGFVGALDNPRVYNRALSAAEVQALYNLPD